MRILGCAKLWRTALPTPTVLFLSVFTSLLLLGPSYVVQGDPTAPQDRKEIHGGEQHQRSNVLRPLSQGYEQLVDRYVPDFAGLSRAIIGRAGDDSQTLANNAPGGGNLRPGDTDYYHFPKTALVSRRSSRATSLPTTDQEQDNQVTEADPTLGKRQSQTMLYISLNTCLQPIAKSPTTGTGPQQLVVYVSTTSRNQKPDMLNHDYVADATNGYASLNFTASDDVFFAVRALNDDTLSGSYNYEFTVSTDDYYATYLDDSHALFLDSDVTTALFYASKPTRLYTEATDLAMYLAWIQSLPFSVSILNADDTTMVGLERSMCALQKGPTHDADTSVTTNGGGYPKQQIHVKGLNASSHYNAIMKVVHNSTGSGDKVVNGGGTVWGSTPFSTKSDGNCALIYNLSFCNDVAYAVPTNPGNVTLSNTTFLGNVYDNYATYYYDFFNKSLQQIPCNTTSSAQYSLARTCDDCDNAYRKWLCAVTIPRCQDFSSEALTLQPRALGQNFINQTNADLGQKYNDQMKMAAFNQSRNPSIDTDIQPGPYKEVLPCIDLCYNLVQSCPAALQFQCPRKGYGLNYSYGRYNNTLQGDQISCNALNLRVSAAINLSSSVWLAFSVALLATSAIVAV